MLFNKDFKSLTLVIITVLKKKDKNLYLNETCVAFCDVDYKIIAVVLVQCLDTVIQGLIHPEYMTEHKVFLGYPWITL